MDSFLSWPTDKSFTCNYKTRKIILPYHYKALLLHQNLKGENG